MLKIVLGYTSFVVILVLMWIFYVGCCGGNSNSGTGSTTSGLTNTQATGGYTPPGTPGPLNTNFQYNSSTIQTSGGGYTTSGSSVVSGGSSDY